MSYLKVASERLSEFIKYGNSRQQKVSRGTFFDDKLKDPEFQPVFVLSTGRAGTTLTTSIFEEDKDTFVIHDHPQDLLFVSKLAYEAYNEGSSSAVDKMAGAAYLAARETDLYSSFLHGKHFIETNNRVTFMAPGIKDLIPHAKFLLLYRHPGDFVRSGMRREYYQRDNYTERGRITHKDQFYWDGLTPEEKIAWLWSTTNDFALEYLSGLPKGDVLIKKFPFDATDDVDEILSFSGLKPLSKEKISQMIAKPVNVQSKGNYPKYSEWNLSLLNKVKAITASVDAKLGIDW